jgi:hypothetical protein
MRDKALSSTSLAERWFRKRSSYRKESDRRPKGDPEAARGGETLLSSVVDSALHISFSWCVSGAVLRLSCVVLSTRRVPIVDNALNDDQPALHREHKSNTSPRFPWSRGLGSDLELQFGRV